MKRRIFIFAVIAIFCIAAAEAQALSSDYNPQRVGAGAPELHINRDGTITLKSGWVDHIVGTTFFLVTKWGSMPMRFTMKTDSKTRVTKRYGGAATVAQIKLGDYLDADGDFFVGSDFFGLTAKNVKDWSLQEESETFSGTIAEMNPNETFTLRNPLGKLIVVRGATSTTIRKGPVNLPWSRLRKGDVIPLVDGVYDYVKNTLTADQIVVFQPTAAFAARNYEGTLKRIDAPRLPTSLIVAVDGAEYTVQMSLKTAVFKKNRTLAELSRFVAGDTVRFYGPLRQEENILRDELVVDAEVVRNLNL